ncbi:MAG: hypothetical protein CMG78_05810 [Marinobacter sp.]|nr:hypothetical protein [Marinobacter sp.]|tara:strand:+ start:423 stop:776 length:354 start_codon:yes stop_codon:yes gene_type:complete
MNDEIKNYEYEDDLDILYINNNPTKQKPISNLVAGNFVIDIGETGKVLGVEIDCASKIFNFPSEQLKNLQTAKVQVMKIGNMLTLGIIITTKMKEHSFQFAIQQESNQTNKIPIASC